MIFIPAIDLKEGNISKAYAGNRKNYKPLQIEKKDFSDPNKFISKLLSLYKIKKIYIADINSLQNSGNNWEVIRQILKDFAKIEFLIDSGFSTLKKIYYFNSFIQKNQKIQNYRIIIGTECFFNQKILKKIMNNRNFILSLDYFNSKKLEINLKDYKNRTIILMFIDQVGARGVNWKEIKKVLNLNILERKNLYVAGGVKYEGEMKLIKLMGLKGCIISSLIHEKIKRGINAP